MKPRSGWIRGPWLVTLLASSLLLTDSSIDAATGGRGGRAPRHAAPRRPNYAPSYKAPRMPNPSASARSNPSRGNNVSAQPRAAKAGSAVKSTTRPSVSGSTTTAARTSTLTPNTYTYGTGKSSKSYHAYSSGRGSRGRSGSSGRRNQNQTNNRAVVSRLRSVHSSLARLDHDYRGHRVQAMHSVSNAIRQLSHRSTSRTVNNNNGRNLAMAGLKANPAGARQGVRLTQAQADGRMSQALRTTQGVQMQMNSQRSGPSSSHLQASNHVARAIREMHTALTVR